jgi:hypothetical protein
MTNYIFDIADLDVNGNLQNSCVIETKLIKPINYNRL